MPQTLELTTPTGETYELEAPDDATPEQIKLVANQAIRQIELANAPGVGHQLAIGAGKVLRGSVGVATDIANQYLGAVKEAAQTGVPRGEQPLSENPFLGTQSITELFGIPEDTTTGERALTAAIEVPANFAMGIPFAAAGAPRAAAAVASMVEGPLAGVLGAVGKEPFRGAAMEAPADITGQVLGIFMGKRLVDVMHAPSVQRAVDALAKKLHMSPQTVALETETVGGLQARLRAEGIGPAADIDPMEVLSREDGAVLGKGGLVPRPEVESVFGGGSFPQAVQRNQLGGMEASLLPWEGETIPDQLTRQSTARFTSLGTMGRPTVPPPDFPEQLVDSTETLTTHHLGPPGPFYGTHVIGEDRVTVKLPRKGPNIIDIPDYEHQGAQGGAPLADAVDRGAIRVPPDIAQLVEGKYVSDLTWDTDRVGLAAAKRQGLDVIHFVDPNDPKKIVSVDLRGLDERRLIREIKKNTFDEPFEGGGYNDEPIDTSRWNIGDIETPTKTPSEDAFVAAMFKPLEIPRTTLVKGKAKASIEQGSIKPVDLSQLPENTYRYEDTNLVSTGLYSSISANHGIIGVSGGRFASPNLEIVREFTGPGRVVHKIEINPKARVKFYENKVDLLSDITGKDADELMVEAADSSEGVVFAKYLGIPEDRVMSGWADEIDIALVNELRKKNIDIAHIHDTSLDVPETIIANKDVITKTVPLTRAEHKEAYLPFGGRAKATPAAEPLNLATEFQQPQPMTTLYRGQIKPGSSEKAPDWMQGHPTFEEMKKARGKWWTDDPNIAKWYVDEAGVKGELVQIQVPTKDLDRFRVVGRPEARFSKDPQHEFFIDDPLLYRKEGKLTAEAARLALEDVDAQARFWADQSMTRSRRAAAEAVNAGGGGGDDIVRYGDSAPGAVLDDEGTRSFANEAIRAGGPAMRLGLPVNAFDDARWHAYWASSNDVKRSMGYVALRLNRKAERLFKGLSSAEQRETVEAIEGLQIQPDGSLLQTVDGISPKIQKIAVAYRHQVTDKLFEVVTGIKAQAIPVVRSLGLEDKEALWKKLRAIQDSPQSFMSKTEAEAAGGVAQFRGTDIKIVSDAEMLAARRTAGMLNFGPTHDVRPIYEQGYFSHMPIPHEMALLQEQKASLEAMMAMGADQTRVDGWRQAIELIERRLTKLQGRIDDQLTRESPLTEIAPRRRFDAHWNIARDPEARAFSWDQDPVRVSRKMINDATRKRYMDHTLGTATPIIDLVKNNATSKRYVMDWLAHQRGVRGFGENQWAVNFWNSLKGRVGFKESGLTPLDIEREANRILRFVATTRLNMSPRYPLMNASQTLTTVLPFVPWHVYARAEARGMAAAGYMLNERVVGSRIAEAMTGRGRWYHARAIARGVVNETEQFLEEAPVQAGLFEKTTRNLGKPAQVMEFKNRVTAYEAFFMDASRPDFKPHAYIKKFVPPEAGPPGTVKYARAYGKAGVDATQFVFGPQGRPLHYAGGGARKLVSQFRSFQSGYAAMMKGLLDAKDYKGFTKAATVLWMLGGLKAGAMGIPLYDWTRRKLMEYGYENPLPERPGLSYLSELVGFGAVSPIDITSSFDVMSTPNGVMDLLGAAGGAAVDMALAVPELQSPVGQRGDQLYYRSPLTAEGGRRVLRAMAPPLLALGQGLREYKEGRAVTAEGPNQKVLRQDAPGAALGRAANLSPAVNQQVRYYEKDIRAATRGGRLDIVKRLLKEAQDRGLVLSPTLVSRTQSAMAKGKTESEGFLDWFAPRP